MNERKSIPLIMSLAIVFTATVLPFLVVHNPMGAVVSALVGIILGFMMVLFILVMLS